MTHKTTLMDVMNTAGQTVGIALDTLNDYNMEVASAELMQQQIKTAKWQQDEMLKFQGRTDFENFEQEYNDDFNDLYGSYNGKSGDSFYRSRYSQKAGNEYLSKLKLEGDSKVKQMVWQGQRDYQTQCYTSAIETLRTQPVSQERLDAEKEIYDTMRSLNLINPNAYFTGIQNTLTAGLYDEIQQEAASWVAEHPNASDQDLDEYLASFTSTLDLTYQDADGSIKSMGIDRDAVKEKARTSYLQGLNRTRSGNNLEISRTNDQLIKDAMTGNGSIAAMQAQQAKIWSMGNMDLTTDDRMDRWTELQRYIDALKAGEAGGSGSAGASQRQAASSELNYAYVKSLLNRNGYDQDIDMGQQEIVNGKAAAYDVYRALQETGLGYCINDPVWQGADGQTRETVWKQVINNYFTGDNGMLTQFMRGKGWSENIIDKVRNTVDLLPLKSDEQRENAVGFIADMICNTALDFSDEKQLTDFIDKACQEYKDNWVTEGWTWDKTNVSKEGEVSLAHNKKGDAIALSSSTQNGLWAATPSNFTESQLTTLVRNQVRDAKRTIGPDIQINSEGETVPSYQPLRTITAPGYDEAYEQSVLIFQQALADDLDLGGKNVSFYPELEKDENGEYTGFINITVTGREAGDKANRQYRYNTGADKQIVIQWRPLGQDGMTWKEVENDTELKREYEHKDHDKLEDSRAKQEAEERKRTYRQTRSALPDHDTWTETDDESARNDIEALAREGNPVDGMNVDRNSWKNMNEQQRGEAIYQYVMQQYGSLKNWKNGTPYGEKE